MKVLVCGSRSWDDEGLVWLVLDGLWDMHGKNLVLIEGGAGGADRGAANWARRSGVPCEEYAAYWKEHGKAAGPLRNRQMLNEGKPELVLAFSEHPITPGTQDMINRAKHVGLTVWVVSHG